MDVLDILVDEATLEFIQVRLDRIRLSSDDTTNKVKVELVAAKTKSVAPVNRRKWTKKRKTVVPYICRGLPEELKAAPNIDFEYDYWF